MISEAAILFRYYSNKVPLIPIPDFYNPNFIQRGRVKRVIDKNHKLHSGGTPAFFSNYGAFNFPILDDNQFFSELYDKFVIKSTELFGEFTLASDNSSTCWASRYNKKMGKRQDSWWHNHAHTSTINAIYYLDIFNYINVLVIILMEFMNLIFLFTKPTLIFLSLSCLIQYANCIIPI